MQARLETIFINAAQSSFKYFIRKEKHLPSFWHFHPEIEITFVERGNGIRFVGDSIKPFQEGDLVMTGSYLPHDYVSDDWTDELPQLVHVFQFNPTIFQSFPECKHLYALFDAALYGLKFKTLPPSIIEKIKNLNQQAPILQLIHFLELLNTLATHKEKELLSSITFLTKNQDKQQDKITEITQFILENRNRPISLEEISNYANRSPPAFCRWFKAAVGNSFITYLNTARIEKACQQLLQSKQRISEIAYQNGFESIGHFNRVFKKIKQISPREYRNKYKEH
jgi:AraC-like DNA-binding protein